MVVLFDQFNLPEDVYDIIFATPQQVDVAKLLIVALKQAGGEIDKTQMSDFATKLHEGIQIKKSIRVGPTTQPKLETLSYNKRQFYDRILTPMKSMGLIDYDLYKKTYKLSNKFSHLTTQLSLMWEDEVKKKPLTKKKQPVAK
jgi:hypothetical protein